MRQGNFSSWLTDFADQGCKTVQASYFDDLKLLIEKKGKKKYATIQDALTDFCSRLKLTVPDMKQVQAGFEGYKQLEPVLAALGIRAFNTEELDRLIGQGMPAEAIANEFGDTEEEKQTIIEYVDQKAGKQREENSQIVRDMKMSDDLVKPMSPGSQAVPKVSSIRSLSIRMAQVDPMQKQKALDYILLERDKGHLGPETFGIVAQHYGVNEVELEDAFKELCDKEAKELVGDADKDIEEQIRQECEEEIKKQILDERRERETEMKNRYWR